MLQIGADTVSSVHLFKVSPFIIIIISYLLSKTIWIKVLFKVKTVQAKANTCTLFIYLVGIKANFYRNVTKM